jgi:hypothetical protein
MLSLDPASTRLAYRSYHAAMPKRLRLDRPERLRVKALYGLETALLLGIACLALVALRPERPGASLLLIVALLLLAIAAGGTLALRSMR